MKKHAILRGVALALTLLFCLLPLGCTDASDSDRYPAPTEAFYVLDEANLLSPSAESYLVERNRALFSLCGAEIVTVTVETTGNEDIADFAAGIFNTWGIGSAERNNGILLLISRREEDYWMLQGKGLESLLSSGTLKVMIDDCLEPHFASQDYEAGVLALFDAITAEMETIYSVSLDSWGGEEGDYTPGEIVDEPSADTSSDVLLWVILIVIIIVLVIVFSSSGGSGGGSSGGGGGRRTRVTYSPFVYTPRPSYRPSPPRPPSTPRPGTSRPGGYAGGSRPGSFSGGSRPASRPGGSYGGSRRPASRPSGGRSGGFSRGGMSRGGGVGRR